MTFEILRLTKQTTYLKHIDFYAAAADKNEQRTFTAVAQ